MDPRNKKTEVAPIRWPFRAAAIALVIWIIGIVAMFLNLDSIFKDASPAELENLAEKFTVIALGSSIALLFLGIVLRKIQKEKSERKRL